MKKNWPILVVDDEDVMCESMAAWLREDGYRVDTASNGQKALESARTADYAICFVDLKMPGGMDGIETMMEIHRVRPDASIIIITAYATVDTAIQAMKEGAQEYIVKPCNPQEISHAGLAHPEAEETAERERDFAQETDPAVPAPRHHHQESAHGRDSLPYARSCQLAQYRADSRGKWDRQRIGRSGGALLRQPRGEAVHRRELRSAYRDSARKRVVRLREGSLHRGQRRRRKGSSKLANGGTIFLDEIGDISPKLQADLLRVLQERRFYRVGGTQEVEVDVRVIAATNKNLAEEVQQGRFREDLYYRLNVIEIRLPPLRERREDIPLLAEHFVQRISSELGRDVSGISTEALKLLIAYDWPGNVRELENVIERAIVTCHNGSLEEQDFSWMQPAGGQSQNWEVPDVPLGELERRAIVAALERKHGNVKEASTALGIDRSTLYDKLKRYEISH